MRCLALCYTVLHSSDTLSSLLLLLPNWVASVRKVFPRIRQFFSIVFFFGTHFRSFVATCGLLPAVVFVECGIVRVSVAGFRYLCYLTLFLFLDSLNVRFITIHSKGLNMHRMLGPCSTKSRNIMLARYFVTLAGSDLSTTYSVPRMFYL